MMVNTKFLQLIVILCLLMQGHILCNGRFNTEAEALLEFKKDLKDPSNLLSSWTLGDDCCHWKGVGCNTTSGHVISLNLHSSNSLDILQGQLSSSLLQLPYLSYLNLSGNDFMQSSLPSFLGTMTNLKHLDQSHANFKGSLFDNPGNLSLLESLDLSGNSFFVHNLKWLHGLSSLKTLDLSGVPLGNYENDWFHEISPILPSLETLRLSDCQLYELPTSPPFGMNLESLITLDLSVNYFSTIPVWLFENCHHLQYLNFSNNYLQGHIPFSIERMTTLATLDLSHNIFTGSIPDSIDKLVRLVVLDLSNNMLNGSIPSKLGQIDQNSLKELRLSNNRLKGSLETTIHHLSKLVVLDLGHNRLGGNITDVHLANFSNLKVLDLSSNSITLNMSKNWVPPFQLETLGLAKCHLGPQFPKWIQTQNNFSHIDISNTSISDTVPNWFWDLSPNVEYMNLSYNELSRCGHDLSQKVKLRTLDLSNNSFSCSLPQLPPNSKHLDLSNNLFYGTVSQVCEILGVNNSLETLDLSFNNLSGVIPNCWATGTSMIILNPAENNFIGLIPDSFGSLIYLHILLMYNNNFSGHIPDTLRNCHFLTFLDLGSNQLTGSIQSWIGTEMMILETLILSRNSFDENIPTTLCQLKSLRILDLSENQLRGEIPRCVFPAMATDDSINEKSYMVFLTIKESLSIYLNRKYPFRVRLKKNDVSLQSSFVIKYLRMIDMSSNSLTQGIPVEITKLVYLHSLNLSRNQLVGFIPSNISELENLEALDLSRNQLSCGIPTTMVNMGILEILDLSYNTLSGELLPQEQQFMTFGNESYLGNPLLCGAPLAQKCQENRNSSLEDTHCRHKENNGNDSNHEDTRKGLGINPFYITMIAGLFTGFWGFWGSILLFTSWRHAYFRFLNNMEDRIYVTVVVTYNKLQRKLHTQQPPQ